MKIIRNNIIPFKGFKAINLFGILFVRGNAELSDEVINSIFGMVQSTYVKDGTIQLEKLIELSVLREKLTTIKII